MRKQHVDIDHVPLPAFGLADDHGPFDSDWHEHGRHQLLYASAGAMRFTTQTESWLLPPLRAAWIPAGTLHRVRAPAALSLRTVYFAPALAPDVALQRCTVFGVNPLGHQMILTAMRWGADDAHDAVAARFFPALAALCSEWVCEPLSLKLPAAKTPELAAAMAYALEHLDSPLTLKSVAKAGGVSERTLERRFEEEAKLSFRDFFRRARMQAAVEFLARPGARVKSAAHAVGFSSEAAFTRAFTEVIGERPTEYQRRLRRALRSHEIGSAED